MSKQDSAKTSISDKLAHLNELVAWFEGDDFSLEDALGKFEKAEELAAEIEKDLAKYKNQINIVKERFDRESA